ncbi:hypothetical protein ACHAXS_005520 [Conticribra weissflogii]
MDTKTNGIRRKRGTKSQTDNTTRIIVALLAGAGAAFLLALTILMSRLESQELRNGLLKSNVGGAKGVDDQVILEEVSQGHASLGIGAGLRQKKESKRREQLVEEIEKAKHVYGKVAEKFGKLTGAKDGNVLDSIVGEAVGEMNHIEGELKGTKHRGNSVDILHDFKDLLHKNKDEEVQRKNQLRHQNTDGEAEFAPHLYPRFPPLPPHLKAEEIFGSDIIDDTLSGEKPTIAGIIAILQGFLGKLHQLLIDKKHATAPEVIDAYFDLVNTQLEPLEHAYRGREIFPIREDQSIFMSLGAYRDHLLGETLRQAFKRAAYPDKLFVGAVVQNCFGIDVQCRTGVEVKGTDANGRPITEVSDRPPDVNGIEEFCNDPEYKQYCDAGQIRALYVNETESNGPTTARYFASKLWGGETYFLQADAHLRFAQDWDRLYHEEVNAAKSYPKAVLSSYPPGFSEEDPPYKGGSQGTRLCTCTFSDSDVEHRILRINTGNQCRGEEAAPSQIAYIAAGFFFARAEFLVDVPFDPFLPWCFMGEEIALSLRAWTHGWDIYAPRKNWIAHQYRPGRMGLPKFWENTGRVFGRPGPGFNTQLQTITIQRVKHMVGYKESTTEWLRDHNYQVVLTDFEHYGPGEIRTREEFLEHTNIDMEKEKCGHIGWCNDCSLE